jgi:subtilisin family serine protease
MNGKRITGRRVVLAVLIISVLLMSGGGASLAAVPASPESSGVERLMVEFAPGRGAAVRSALERAGGRIHHEFDDLNVIAVTLPVVARQGIERNPNVVLVAEDAPRYPMGQTTPWGTGRVQAPEVWGQGGPTGTGITVCVIDSGLYTDHEDFAGVTVKGGYPTTGWDTDACGHGTHVAGTIAAANNSVGVVGVSPGVSLFIVKVFGDSCAWTYSSDLIDATNRCKSVEANIISMSLGGGKAIGPWEQRQFDGLYRDGYLSVAAAGNEGNTKLSYPASYDSVISVAATDINNVVADFSQKNSQVELAAPGVDVLSTVPWIANSSLTVDTLTYQANHIENAKYGSASGGLVDGGLCTSAGSWSGNVVLCERGDVSFYDKVRNVQISGGAAAVIYNNEPGNLYATLGDGNSSTIPAISLSQADGQYLVGNKLGLTGAVASTISKPASGYEAWNGTSMATPHVSGVAALLWSYKPGLTNAQIRAAMNNTALDLGAAGRDNSYGYGLVQACAAFKYLGGVCTDPLPPDEPTTGTISGTVRSQDGGAIKGATVAIEGTDHSTTTLDDGSYTLANVPVGTYSVTASKAGYVSSKVEEVVVFENDPTTLSFILKASPTQEMTASVTVSVVRRGQNAAATARVVVTSEDQSGSEAVVSGAVVSGTWYLKGTLIGSPSGVTDANGVATFESGNFRAAKGDTFEFCVTGITRDGYLYTPTGDCGEAKVP